MSLPVSFLRSLVSSAGLLPLALIVACGGRTFLSVGPDPSDGGIGIDVVDASRRSDARGACFDIDLSTYDRSCDQSSDCLSVNGGVLCPDTCLCGGTFINASGEARYAIAIAPVRAASTAECSCIGVPPVCVGHTCQPCDPTTNPGCSELDAGPPADGMTGDDTSLPDAGWFDVSSFEGGQCVDINLATYDRSCTESVECIDITAGVICAGDCACGGASVNESEQARYDSAINSIVTVACKCQSLGTPTCVHGLCVWCNGAGSTNGANCPDSGL